MRSPVRRVRSYKGMPVHQFFAEWFFWIHPKTDLFKKHLKPIVFKQVLIIRRIEIHPPERLMKSFGDQSPPVIPFTEINRTVHSAHSALDQPVFGHVKKLICCVLVVDTIEKTDPADRKFISLAFIPLIYKSGNPAHPAAVFIFQDPTGGFALTEGFIFFRIENILNIFILRTDITRQLT